MCSWFGAEGAQACWDELRRNVTLIYTAANATAARAAFNGLASTSSR
jgi:hypothetical protein